MGFPYPPSGASVPANILPTVDILQMYQGQMRLFILAGQSNMVGWAPVPEGEKSDPRVYVFSKDYRWQIASEPKEKAFNQVDKVSEDRIAGFGPSLAFALSSLEHRPEIVIGLIPCAKNASAIIEWRKNLSDQSLYGSPEKSPRSISNGTNLRNFVFFRAMRMRSTRFSIQVRNHMQRSGHLYSSHL